MNNVQHEKSEDRATEDMRMQNISEILKAHANSCSARIVNVTEGFESQLNLILFSHRISSKRRKC